MRVLSVVAVSSFLAAGALSVLSNAQQPGAAKPSLTFAYNTAKQKLLER